VLTPSTCWFTVGGCCKCMGTRLLWDYIMCQFRQPERGLPANWQAGTGDACVGVVTGAGEECVTGVGWSVQTGGPAPSLGIQ
jgi:hypothetical protein